MRCTVGGAHRAEGVLEKRADFLYPMAQLQTRQLKLTGDFAHIFAGSSEEVDAALREFCGFGLRARAPIADPEAVLHPAREGIQHLAIIDRAVVSSKPQSRPASSPWTWSLKPSHRPMPILDLRPQSRKG